MFTKIVAKPFLILSLVLLSYQASSIEEGAFEDGAFEENTFEESEFEENTHDEVAVDLQIGSEFGRSFVKTGKWYKVPLHLQKAARSAAEFGTGSAFYIGEFNGKHLMGTNAHVLTAFSDFVDWSVEDYLKNPEEACKVYPGVPESERNYVRFGFVNRDYECKKVVGIWPEVDFAIFEIDVEDNYKFFNMGISISKGRSHYKGQKLSMFSYSSFKNPGEYGLDLGYTKDRHCSAFSNKVLPIGEEGSDEPKVWSFPTGCDISPGDSGSALVGRNNGRFVGIIWSGVNNKITTSKKDRHLDILLRTYRKDQNLVWENLNYAVPRDKIIESIEASLHKKSAEDRKTLEEALNINSLWKILLKVFNGNSKLQSE